MSPAPTELFGGAITASLPSTLRDASELRQIPDSQEVYLATDSDLSFILEVLQLVTEDGAADSLEAAVKFHFSSLAHDNTALTSTIKTISLPSPSPPTTIPLLGPTILTGEQTISKFNLPDSAADTVLIQLALWRLPTKNADLVLSVNFPIQKAGEPVQDPDEAKRLFEEAVRTLMIKDFGLFAG